MIHVILSAGFIALHICNVVASGSILGCGGFLKSSSASLLQVKVHLLTTDGIVKYETDSAPHNGYYFLPAYDKGKYVVKVIAPEGWTFEPAQFLVDVDGEKDVCSRGEDLNFVFLGFTVRGQVVTRGSMSGPVGVSVTLTPPEGEHHEVTTVSGGHFSFGTVPPGSYKVSASHSSWKLSPSSVDVSLQSDNVDVGRQLVVIGYDVTGQVEKDGAVVSGVHVVLHADTTVDGCKGAPPADYRPPSVAPSSLPLPPAQCAVLTDSQGRYTFTAMPNGRYVLSAHYRVGDTVFQLSPAHLPVIVDNNSKHVTPAFQVKGFSVSGRVLLSEAAPSIVGLKEARVFLNGQQMAVTDAHGRFTIGGIRGGKYTLTVEADAVRFNSRELDISPTSSVLPSVLPASFRVCGRVDMTQLPAGVTPGPRLVELLRTGSEQWLSVETSAAGDFCTFLQPGTYKTRAPVNEAEVKLGLHFGSAHAELVVDGSPVSGLVYSPFRGRVAGRVDCLPSVHRGPPSCGGQSVQLVGVDRQPSRSTQTAADGRFQVDQVLPGEYRASVLKDEWCWQSDHVSVTVSSQHDSDVRLVQSGFRLIVQSSHPTQLHYRLQQSADDSKSAAAGVSSSAASEPTAGEMTVSAGTSRLCVPRAGVYLLKPLGCHTFSNTPVRVDTAEPSGVAQLQATHHRVSGMVTVQQQSKTSGTVVDHSRNVQMALEGEPTLSVDVEWMDAALMTFSVMAPPARLLTFRPTSDQLVFSPDRRTLQSGGECLPDAVTFTARPGAFVTGVVGPALSGVRITVTGPHMEPVHVATDRKGSYRVGPLPPDVEYSVSAERLGYEISPVPDRTGHFTSRKLSQLRVRVTGSVAPDAAPLPGVLISVSGDDGFRDNRLTDSSGETFYPSLGAGQLFVRSVMKEYEFDPISQLIDIIEGESKQLNISGNRVAYSLLGRTVSLSGEAESEVVVEAAGSGSCKGQLEQAVSDTNGMIRIRGLKPKCEYDVRVRATGSGVAGVSPARAIPVSRTIQMSEADVSGVRMVVFRPRGEATVTGRIVLLDPALPSSAGLWLVIEVATGDEPALYSTRLGPGAPALFRLPSPLPLDGRQYSVRLQRASTHDPSAVLAAVTLTPSGRGHFVTLTVRPEAERMAAAGSESDGPSGSPTPTNPAAGHTLILPVCLLLAVAVFHRHQLQVYWRQLQMALRAMYTGGATGQRPGGGIAARIAATAVDADRASVIVRPVLAKAKAKKI